MFSKISPSVPRRWWWWWRWYLNLIAIHRRQLRSVSPRIFPFYVIAGSVFFPSSWVFVFREWSSCFTFIQCTKQMWIVWWYYSIYMHDLRLRGGTQCEREMNFHTNNKTKEPRKHFVLGGNFSITCQEHSYFLRVCFGYFDMCSLFCCVCTELKASKHEWMEYLCCALCYSAVVLIPFAAFCMVRLIYDTEESRELSRNKWQ